MSVVCHFSKFRSELEFHVLSSALQWRRINNRLQLNRNIGWRRWGACFRARFLPKTTWQAVSKEHSPDVFPFSKCHLSNQMFCQWGGAMWHWNWSTKSLPIVEIVKSCRRLLQAFLPTKHPVPNFQCCKTPPPPAHLPAMTILESAKKFHEVIQSIFLSYFFVKGTPSLTYTVLNVTLSYHCREWQNLWKAIPSIFAKETPSLIIWFLTSGPRFVCIEVGPVWCDQDWYQENTRDSPRWLVPTVTRVSKDQWGWGPRLK